MSRYEVPLEVEDPLQQALPILLCIRSRHGALNQECKNFLVSELGWQVRLPPPNPELLNAREDYGETAGGAAHQLWDLRVRTADFLRRFLEVFRDKPEESVNDFSVFLLQPRSRLGAGHVQSGLFGYSYYLDDGQRAFLTQMLKTHKGYGDKLPHPDVLSKQFVPPGTGHCGELFRKGHAVAHSRTSSRTVQYDLKQADLAKLENEILGKWLIQVPIPWTGLRPIEATPDGPELILGVSLGGDENASPFKPWEEAIFLDSASRRVTQYASYWRPLQEPKERILGVSPAIRTLKEEIDGCARSDGAVIITGDSGTGKELTARAIHATGDRRDGKFVGENCAAIPEQLMESEFFGSVKGAFTGALDRAGLFEQATGGTLFLDEVGEMSLDMQKKFLRVLQEGEVRRVGGQKTITVNFRLMAATNANLEVLVRTGKLREDLYYRLCVLSIHAPRLADRGPDDTRILLNHFLTQEARKIRVAAPIVSDAAWKDILACQFPGNVRQLENFAKRCVARCPPDGVISKEFVGKHLASAVDEPEVSAPQPQFAAALKSVLLAVRGAADARGQDSPPHKRLGVSYQTYDSLLQAASGAEGA